MGGRLFWTSNFGLAFFQFCLQAVCCSSFERKCVYADEQLLNWYMLGYLVNC